LLYINYEVYTYCAPSRAPEHKYKHLLTQSLEQCAEPLAQYTLPYNYGDQAVVTFFLVKSTDSQVHFTADIFPGSPSHLQCINGITVRYLLLGLI